MAHYALINEDNIVINVIVGRDENEIIDGIFDWEDYYSKETGLKVLRTSYNTHAGVHQKQGEPFRKNYAGIGYTYDFNRNAFIAPKPSDDAVLDEETCTWILPAENTTE